MSKITSFLYLTSLLACYLSFWWSVIGVFKLKNRRLNNLYTSLKVLSVIFWVSSLYLWYTTHISQNFIWLGIGINCISLALFWWSQNYIKSKTFSVVFGKDIPQTIETQGPYRFVRHPFYSSYLLCYMTTAFVFFSPFLIINFMGLFFIYLVAIKIEESKFIQSEHIKTFIEYRSRTGALIPKFKRSSENHWKKAN